MPKSPTKKRARKAVKAWALICSDDVMNISAFEPKAVALKELSILRKNGKRDGLSCTHNIVPVLISFPQRKK